jgi:hypothetical protein
MSFTYRVCALALVGVLGGSATMAATSCQDGQSHPDGECRLQFDGSYTTSPRLRMLPSGGGTASDGARVRCPDGQYYPGTRCFALPNGQYTGTP